VTLDGIIETMTYVMWREKRLWNVSIFQRMHISDIVSVTESGKMYLPVGLLFASGENFFGF
jgi:hypothetical protein